MCACTHVTVYNVSTYAWIAGEMPEGVNLCETLWATKCWHSAVFVILASAIMSIE